MNLRKLIVIEVGSVILAVVLIIVFIEITPFLSASQKNSIGMYNQKTYAEGNATLTRGQIIQSSQFNYNTFDPAILVIDLTFQSWQSTGNISLSINGRTIGEIVCLPVNPQVRITAISFSGTDLVEPASSYSRILTNQVYFSSISDGGYEGTFSYKISIRGSR
jgi:hypothetical protein